MSGKEQWVISRMRNMAICRGKATTLCFRPDRRSETFTPKCSATTFRMVSGGISRTEDSTRRESTSRARSMLISRLVREACAPIRMRDPSSSRMLFLIMVARKRETSGGSGIWFLVEDGESCLQVRRLNVRHESPLEAGLDPLLEIGDLLRELVAGHDDLLPGGVQVIEGMKKLLLRALLSRDELDVVDQKHVDVSVLLLEVGHPVCAQAEDELVREFFRGYVENPDA